MKKAHEYSMATDLSAALRTFSGNPNLKGHLPEAIRKLGRYYSAACELVCPVRDRKYSLFQNIRVEPFQVPMPASVKDAKVHSAIQLLFFYELHPDRPRPRIICSSKNACYLCNLFFQLHGGFQAPRTHGRLYEKWIIPDWLDIPAERHESLGVVLTRLKTILRGRIQRQSEGKKKKTKHCEHPNESVLLPAAHWTSPSSAPSKSVMTTSSASMSTIRPRAFILEGNAATKLPLEMPLTPPRTPLELRHGGRNTDSDTGPVIAPSGAKIADNPNVSVSSSATMVSIGYNDLPYSQSVTLVMPSLHVQLDGLSITLDFIQVVSSRLSITQAEGFVGWSKEYRCVGIEDIPTTTELQLNCSHSSQQLVIQM